MDQAHPDQTCVFGVKRDVLEHVDKPPTCLLCGAEFALACLLKAHVLEAHGQDGVEQHKTVVLEDDYSFPDYTLSTTLTFPAPVLPGPNITRLVPEENSELVCLAQPSIPPGSITKFHCDFCEFDVNDLSLLEYHIMMEHGEEVAKEQRELHPAPAFPQEPGNGSVSRNAANEGSADRLFKCPSCPYSSSEKKSFRSHVKTHERFRT